MYFSELKNVCNDFKFACASSGLNPSRSDCRFRHEVCNGYDNCGDGSDERLDYCSKYNGWLKETLQALFYETKVPISDGCQGRHNFSKTEGVAQ